MAKKKLSKIEEVAAIGEAGARTAVQQAIFAKYQYMFEPIPDRRLNALKTGIPSLDHALGGGFPRGQFVHIFGREGSGKSTLAQTVTASIQREKGKGLYLDPENSLDKPYSRTIGMTEDLDDNYLRKYPSGEYLLDMVEDFVRADMYRLIVFDTIAAMISKKTIESPNVNDDMTIKARMISKAIEKLNHAIVEHDTIVLFVNQERSNIGAMGHAKKTTTPGGMTMKYYANINISTRDAGRIEGPNSTKENPDIIGKFVEFTIEKNKINAPLKKVQLALIFGEGFRRDWDLINSAIVKGFIRQSGSWFKYNGESVGQGFQSLLAYAKEHPEWLDTLEDNLYGNNTNIEPEVSSSNGESVQEVEQVQA